jgi:hypothetical protein
MNDSRSAAQVSIQRGLLRWAVKQTVFVLILGVALFASKGSLTGARAWTYLILVAGIQIFTSLILIPRSPDLLVERSQMKDPWHL